MENENEPWWNDRDKVGGLAATIFLIFLAVAVGLIILGLGIKIFFALI